MAVVRKPVPKKAPSPASLARRGRMKALMSLENPRDAYKWLCAAGDFGHDEADEYVSDLLEGTALRFDDGGHEVAAAHWELASAYLEGTDGLPRDLQRAAQHLEQAFAHHRTLEALNAGLRAPYSADALRERLPDDARAVLEDGLAGNDFNRAARQVEELRHLLHLGHVPTVIVNGARRALRRTVAALCPIPDGDEVGGADPLADEIALLEETLATTSAGLARLRAEERRREALRSLHHDAGRATDDAGQGDPEE